MEQIPIVVFKTITGEIGIGKLNEQANTIEKVLFVALKPPENLASKPQIALIPPFAPLSDKFPSISLKHIMFYESVTNEQVKRLYLQATTDLAIPEANDIKTINNTKSIGKIVDFSKIMKK